MIEVGSKAWLGPWTLIDDGEAYQYCGETHFEGEVLMAPPDRDCIPDVPNLPAIARYLAQHPETVDALDMVIQAANAMEEFIPASLPDRRNAPGIVSELLKAMRGEGGHE